MSPLHKILIVDHHPAVRIGISHILKKFEPVELGEAGNVPTVYTKLKEQDWDLIILELNLPGRGGLELLRYLRTATETKALVYSTGHVDDVAVRSIKAGASAYVPKDATVAELREAVAASLAGRKYIQPAVADLLAREIERPHDLPPHKLLSDREYETFIKLAMGKTPSAIAQELHLSVSTINTYRSRILRKMQLSGNTELTRYAIDRKLI